MLSVLLTLLKIVGIVLLSLLGIVLLLLLIVLFVPVRYRLKGYYKEEFVCHGRITWLLHLVSVRIDFQKELVTSVRIFGFDISGLLMDKRKSSSESESQTDLTVQPSSTKSPLTITEDINSMDITGIPTVNDENTSTPQKKDNANKFEADSDIKEKQSIFQKIEHFIINIKNKVVSIYKKITDILQDIKAKKDSVSRYIRILQREEVKNTFSLCKKRIFKMIKHLLPKKMKIHAHIGMEDPASTGYILAAYSVLPDKFRKQIILKADFNNVITEADFNIKGSCNAFRLLFELLCIITNKNCWTFYKLVKKEISNERK